MAARVKDFSTQCGLHQFPLKPIQVFSWFSDAPENLQTRKQLAAQGLAPGGPVRARVVWRRGQRTADLFAVEEARRKKTPTKAQIAALAAAREQQERRRCTCGRCGRLQPFRIGGESCDMCKEDERREVRAAASQCAQRLLALGDRAVVLDTETTDLYGFVVEIAIISLTGEILLNERVNPLTPITRGAESVHGINAVDVATAPPFQTIWPRVRELLAGRRAIAFHASHERTVLSAELARIDGSNENAAWLRSIKWRCIMLMYAEFVGEWSEHHGNYQYQPLPGGDHSALGDCCATLRLLQRIARMDQD